MPTPTVEGDIVLGTAAAGVMLRNDNHLPIASTTSGTYWAWVEDFNPIPPVDMATNDKPIVYDYGSRAGGDIPIMRRYQFEFYAEWATSAGLADLLADLTALSVPLQSGTTEMSFMFAGIVWTLAGRYEPISMARTELALSKKIGVFLVRFRATDPVLRGAGAQTII